MMQDLKTFLQSKKELLSNADNHDKQDDIKLEYDILKIITLKSDKEKLTPIQLGKKYKVSHKLLIQSEKGNFDPTIDDLKNFGQEMKVKLTMEIVDAGKSYKTL